MKRILAFTALLAWCGVLLALRASRAHNTTYFFLVWNLFLAAVPFAAALLFERAKGLITGAITFVVWLVFLPNAPYILTDFIHLRPRPPVPLWFDVLLLLSAAGTGLLLGYGSVMIVQRVIERRRGTRTGWLVATVALFLSAFGIYLGRFVRFNSWEVVTDPMPLFADISYRLLNPAQHPRTFAVTALYGFALLLGYVALHVVSEDRAG
ncbi:MAG TPA: DUF1361 domain-containing protein [Thermoanaerobaculia bacterium]